MSYIKAEEVLPQNVIAMIQQYIDGQNIYIPKKNNSRAEWGEKTGIKTELEIRNRSIYDDYLLGLNTESLARPRSLRALSAILVVVTTVDAVMHFKAACLHALIGFIKLFSSNIVFACRLSVGLVILSCFTTSPYK